MLHPLSQPRPLSHGPLPSGPFPNGETRLFPVLGDPVAQVRSPAAISAILARRGHNALTVAMQVAPADLAALLEALSHMGNLDGALITVPHKFAALAACTSMTERAAFIGSANVLRKTAQGWHGENTDGEGFFDGLAQAGIAVAGRRVLLVGAGGAGTAIAYEMLLRGAAQLAIHDTDKARRDSVLSQLQARFPGRCAIGSADPRGYDLIANATPLGMRPDDPYPVDVALLTPDQAVTCVVTRPAITPLIEAARALCCATMTGNGMFDAQAEALTDFLTGVTKA